MAYDFSKLDGHLTETEEWLARELSSIRTGRATPTLLDGVKPEVYGTRTLLVQVASVTIEDARTLRIVPWDKSLVKVIEKAVIDADLGVGVGSDEQGVRVSFPELTAERRTMLTKLAKDKLEQSRITLRGHRGDAIKEIEAAEKEGGMGKDDLVRYKEDIQKKIDAAGERLELVFRKKEQEMSI